MLSVGALRARVFGCERKIREREDENTVLSYELFQLITSKQDVKT